MVLQSIIGLIAFLGIAWCLGERGRIPWRIIASGLLLQFLLALLLLKVPVFSSVFLSINNAVLALESATNAGTAMVFGFLGGGDAPFETTSPANSYILAFRGLPLVLVISALSALLFYWRVLPAIVSVFSRFFQKALGIGGAEGVGVSANVFIGMVEAPLLIRPYLNKMTRSELLSLMTCGLATVAGTVMVLYASILGSTIPSALSHILTASLISVPAAVVIAKIMLPETEPLTNGAIGVDSEYASATDAIAQGTVRGLALLLNIIAMIIVFVALIHLFNLALALLPQIDGSALTLQRLLGWLMAPLVWLFGIPWSEAVTAGGLMGTKTVINELIAYLHLSQLGEHELSARSQLLMTYALCGFANPGSLGIMIGGLTTMAPERRTDITSLAWRAFVGGTLATCMTAAVVNVIL